MSVGGMQRAISVTGVGRVAAMPDLLVLSLAVETQAVTISEALAENNKQVAAVLSVLKDHGVQERDIQTTHLSIDPVAPPQDPHDRHTLKIVGYRARNGLSAKLRDIQRAGVVIDAAVQAAGDAIRIEGVSFSFAEPASLVSAARKRAIEDAKDRARQLTDGLGVGLGNVLSISESDSSGAPTIREFRSFEFAAPTPFLSGESEVSLQVTVSYEISTK
jgi:uncharacterized protein